MPNTKSKPAKPEVDPRQKCEEIMRAIRGIGIPGSQQLVKTFSDALVNKIVAADSAGNRAKVQGMINADAEAKRIAAEKKTTKKQ